MVQFAPTAQTPTSDPLARAQRLAALIEATPAAPSRPSQSIGEAAARGIGAGLNAYRAAKLAGAEGDARMSRATSLADIILPGGDPNDPKRQALINYVAGGGQVNDTIMRSLGLGAPAEPIIHEVFDQATGQKTYAISNDGGRSWEPFGGVEKPADTGTWTTIGPNAGGLTKMAAGLPAAVSFDKPVQVNSKTREVKPVSGALVENNFGEKLLPGQKKADEIFAQTYVDWKAAGGVADVNKQLAQLDDALKIIEDNPGITGPAIGQLPSWAQAVVNPKGQIAQDYVEEVVQRNLRIILGAQFTENEGKRLIARAYNSALPAEENAKRVRRLIGQIQAMADAKNAAVQYWDQNGGTLAGYTGPIPSKASLDAIDFGGDGPAPPEDVDPAALEEEMRKRGLL